MPPCNNPNYAASQPCQTCALHPKYLGTSLYTCIRKQMPSHQHKTKLFVNHDFWCVSFQKQVSKQTSLHSKDRGPPYGSHK